MLKLNRPTANEIKPWQFGAFLGLFIAVLFPDVLFGSSSFFYRDFGLWAYPNATYHRYIFWRGEVPLWNPYNNCGIPFLAQWNTITLYPPSLLYLLLPLPWSLNLFCLTHLWLAGMGMFLLARRWTNDGAGAAIAGTAYALNGLTLHSLMWPQIIAALGWFPLVVLVVQHAWRKGGRWLAFAAVVGAMQMMTGAAEIILLTWFAVLVTGLAIPGGGALRMARTAWRPGLIIVLVTLLSTMQLLPFLELAGKSQRTSAFGDSSWSVPAFGWANFLVPLFHQSKSIVGVYSHDAQQWTSSYYAGVAVILLSAIAVGRVRSIRILALLSLSLFAFFMSMGEQNILYRGLKAVLPQMGYFRFPVKFVVLVIFALPLLAAHGLQAFKDAGRDRARTAQALLVLWGVICAAMVGIVWVSFLHPATNENWKSTLLSGISRGVFVTLVASALWRLNRADTRPIRFRTQWIIPVLIALDAATHAPRQNPSVSAALLKAGVWDLAIMPRLGAGRAMVSPEVEKFMEHAATTNLSRYFLGQRATLFKNCNLIDRVPKTTGFYPLYPREGAEVERLFSSATNSFPSGLADFLGAVQISSSQDIFNWAPRATALPLITAGQRVVSAGVPTVLASMAAPEFDAREVVYFSEGTKTSIHSERKTKGRAEILRFSPHRIEALVELEAEGPVVVAQSFAPGWKAHLDANATTIHRANHAFQVVESPAGRHTLTLAYQDLRFQSGLIISGLAAVGCAMALRRSSRRRRNYGPSTD